jgi:hypothetical protein
LSKCINLENFSSIAERYLAELGFDPHYCATEEEARLKISELLPQKKWPVYFFQSDTTGEKDFEEFFTENENLELDRFLGIGVISYPPIYDDHKLSKFEEKIESILKQGCWEKSELVDLFNYMIPEFTHKETGKYLDNRM